MTLLVRDEEDILGEHLEYHLNAGVDLVIATDHRSQDGTRRFSSSYARRRRARMLREEGSSRQQAAWQTRMARLAATEHAADWVIHSDADEFWWPRGSSFKETLERGPSPLRRRLRARPEFVPPRDDDGWFVDRMTAAAGLAAPINDPATPFRPVVKVAHRGDPGSWYRRAAGTRSSVSGTACSERGIRSTSCTSRSGQNSVVTQVPQDVDRLGAQSARRPGSRPASVRRGAPRRNVGSGGAGRRGVRARARSQGGSCADVGSAKRSAAPRDRTAPPAGSSHRRRARRRHASDVCRVRGGRGRPSPALDGRDPAAREQPRGRRP